MARRVKLKFFLDNCVPDSVGHVLREAGHTVIFQRESIAPDAADTAVALASAQNDAILVTFDRDHSAIASRFNVSNIRLRKLSRIDFACIEPKAAERIKAGLSFIEEEWRLARKSRDRRLFIVILGNAFKTVR